MRTRFSFLHILFTIGCCYVGVQAGARADTIISVTGEIKGLSSFIGGSPFSVLATSWSSTQAYDNVQISASIGSLDPHLASGTAFLSTRIGPGTTEKDVIAIESFTAPITSSYSSPVDNTIIFSNLSLKPGIYFLILSGVPSPANPMYWNDHGVVNISLGTGVTFVKGIFFAFGNSANAVYPPSSKFSFTDVDKPFFDAIGNALPAPKKASHPDLPPENSAMRR